MNCEWGGDSTLLETQRLLLTPKLVLIRSLQSQRTVPLLSSLPQLIPQVPPALTAQLLLLGFSYSSQVMAPGLFWQETAEVTPRQGKASLAQGTGAGTPTACGGSPSMSCRGASACSKAFSSTLLLAWQAQAPEIPFNIQILWVALKCPVWPSQPAAPGVPGLAGAPVPDCPVCNSNILPQAGGNSPARLQLWQHTLQAAEWQTALLFAHCYRQAACNQVPQRECIYRILRWYLQYLFCGCWNRIVTSHTRPQCWGEAPRTCAGSPEGVRCLHWAQPCASSFLSASFPLIPVFGKANTWWITQKHHTADNTWQLTTEKNKQDTWSQCRSFHSVHILLFWSVAATTVTDIFKRN